MNFKCPVPRCNRTFSQRTAYTQHVNLCIKKLEIESDSDSDSDSSENNENKEEKYESDDICDSFESQMSFETQSNLLSEISIVNYSERFERLESSDSEADEPDFFEEIEFFDESKNPKTEFPNEAYKELMLLVTNNKLNNNVGNAIIRFFNKHSNLQQSPLPKNIKIGREFMNKMEYPNLTFNKISVKHYNGNEYFLHYQNLINCIKNILEVPGITDNFALSYENY